MMRRDPLPFVLAAYLLGAIVTFGHAAARQEQFVMSANCASLQLREADDLCRIWPVLPGAMWAALWPLYWSQEAWS